MRKICYSENTACRLRLSCTALSRSVPKGFSMMMREFTASPASPSICTTGSARRRNLRHAFTLTDDAICRRQAEAADTIWVVDDILTTGATLHFTARAAKKLGRPVKALSLARASPRQ